MNLARRFIFIAVEAFVELFTRNLDEDAEAMETCLRPEI